MEKLCAVYSHRDFNYLMFDYNWSDDFLPDDVAIISICNCDGLSDNGDEHWFKKETDSVLNLDFYDVSDDDPVYGHLAITDEQAERCCEFIINNYGKDFYIHCSAGISRSQGVSSVIQQLSEVIAEYKGVEYVKYCELEDNPCRTPNYSVVYKIRRAFLKKLGIYAE